MDVGEDENWKFKLLFRGEGVHWRRKHGRWVERFTRRCGIASVLYPWVVPLVRLVHRSRHRGHQVLVEIRVSLDEGNGWTLQR